MQSLNAFANAGSAFINLQFAVGTDMQATMLEVISRMNQLPPLPRDAQAPQISLGEDGGNGPNNTLSWFFVQLLPGTPGPIDNYRRQIEELFRNRIESIPGVSNVRINFGSDEELQIVFDPARAAELGIQIPRIAQVAGSADDVSGGFVDIGRRQYTVRFAGRYSMEQFADLVIEWRDGRPVRLGDIATVQVRRGDRSDLALQNGNPAIGIQIMKENDANVLDTLTAVKAEINSLRDNELKKLGLSIAQSFDPSVFIGQAIDMVTGNLFAGILLAVAVLWYFVRDRRATLLVGLSIPICLTVTLVMLYAFGRTLNVISLAGLAFGVGQALDTAIVMLEAIAQQRERGLAKIEATLAGAKQVWPALLASTVTAVIVFLPIVFMRDAVSQLFADLALTISIAVIASLIVAVTALPLAASRWLNTENVQHGIERQVRGRGELDRALDRLAKAPLSHRGRVVHRARGAHLGTAAAARLPAAREARRHRRIHPAAARHQHRHGRAGVRQTGGRAPRAVHGGRETTRAQELLHPRRRFRHHASACARSTPTTSTSSTGSSTRKFSSDFRTPSLSRRRATCSADSATAAISISSCRPPTSRRCWPPPGMPRSSSRKRCPGRRCRPSRAWKWPSRSCA